MASPAPVPPVTPVPSTVHETVLQRAGDGEAGATAVWCSLQGTLSYADLPAAVDTAARQLAGQCSKAAPLVGIVAAEGGSLVVYMLAAMAAGGSFVMLSPEHPPERLRTLCHLLDVQVVVVADGATRPLGSTPGFTPGSTPPPPPPPPPIVRMLPLSELAAGRGTTSADPGRPPLQREPTPTCPAPRAGWDTVCCVHLTSGTTGIPKVVRATHRNVLAYARANAATRRVRAGERVFLASRVTFDPFAAECLTALSVGACVCLCGHHATLTRLGRCLEQSKAQHVCTTPAQWSLVDTLGPLQALRSVALGGEAMAPGLAQQFRKQLPGCRLFNYYGLTEGFAYQTALDMTRPDADARAPSCIGTPLPGLEAALFPCPDLGGGDAPGSKRASVLCLRGEQVCEGPWLREPAVGSGRWLWTGDLATASETEPGAFVLLGRQSQLVKVHGVRLDLAEVRARLLAAPLVRLASVVLHQGALTAYVELHDGLLAPEAVALVRSLLTARCSQALATEAVPRSVVVLRRMPTSATGKASCDPERLAAASQLPGGSARGGGVLEGGMVRRAPRTPLEHLLARHWAFLLGVPSVAATDNFVHLGGQSLLAIRLVNRLETELDLPAAAARTRAERELGVIAGPLAPQRVLELPVLADYARFLHSHGARTAASTDGDGGGSPADPLETREQESEERLELRTAILSRSVGLVGLWMSARGAPDCLAAHGRGRVHGFTPLHHAASVGFAAAVPVLLAAGASVTATTAARQMPAHFAAEHCADTLALLLEAGSPPKATDGKRMTLLHYAARSGHSDVLELLLARGLLPAGSLDGKDHWHRTPLHWAVVNGHAAFIQRLLQAGASASPPYSPLRRQKHTRLRQEAPLHIAARLGRADIARALLDHGADLEVADKDGNRPLHLAVAYHDPWLHDPDPGFSQAELEHHARESSTCASLLIARGAQVDAVSLVHGTAAQAACRAGQFSLVSALGLEAGAREEVLSLDAVRGEVGHASGRLEGQPPTEEVAAQRRRTARQLAMLQTLASHLKSARDC